MSVLLANYLALREFLKFDLPLIFLLQFSLQLMITRLLLHAHHISKTKPNSEVLIISSDTDVAILLLSLGGTISVEALHLHTDMKRSECILDIKTI